MSKHDDRTSLHHMLDHAREAMAMIQGRSRKILWSLSSLFCIME
jgi:hypothetical protein